MPFLNELLKYRNDYFVETGTYMGETVQIVLDNGFKNIISIELSEVFFNNCVKKFQNNENVTICKGNSRYDLYDIIHNIDKPITFWLDGHWSGVENIGIDTDCSCPILYELEQIKLHPIKTHTIMVDDIRLMDGHHFKVSKDDILNKIMEINPDYKIIFYNDDYSDNDVLVAYIEKVEKKTVIHNYLSYCKTNPQPPGFGDFIRGTIALYELSKIYNYELLIDNSHPIFKLLVSDKIVENKWTGEVYEFLPPTSYEDIYTQLEIIFKKNESFSLLTNSFYENEITDDCKAFLKDVLTPNDELNGKIDTVYQTMNLNTQIHYSVIHLRFGDNYLHNDVFNEYFLQNSYNKIYEFIKNHPETQFVLLTDSNVIGNELKKRIPSLFYFNNKKIHLGDLKNMEHGVSDTLVDFFIMTKSEKIFYLNHSGFSRYICEIYNKNYIQL